MQQDRMLRMGLAGLGLAHELNGPLTTTALALELLAERLRTAPPSPADVADELDRILASVRRMGGLIRHLRALARGERTGVGEVALDEVVDAALRLARGAVADFGAVEVVRGARCAAGRVWADALLLEQAVLCLVLNAAEAATSQVEVAAGPDEVVVSDDGPGFAPPTGPGETTKPHGMGVGLALARLIVEEAGGTLAFEHLPVGTRIRLHFPSPPAP